MKMKINNGPELDISTPAGLMRGSIAQLKSYRDRSGNLQILERDIKIMEWVLAQPDADKRAAQFFEARFSGDTPIFDRAAIMKKLGWNWQ